MQFTCDAVQVLCGTPRSLVCWRGCTAYPTVKVQPTKLKVVLTGFIAIPAIKVVYTGVDLATALQRPVSWLPSGCVVYCGSPCLSKNKAQQRNNECA